MRDRGEKIGSARVHACAWMREREHTRAGEKVHICKRDGSTHTLPSLQNPVYLLMIQRTYLMHIVGVVLINFADMIAFQSFAFFLRQDDDAAKMRATSSNDLINNHHKRVRRKVILQIVRRKGHRGGERAWVHDWEKESKGGGSRRVSHSASEAYG